MDHVAIMKRSWGLIPKIISGTKTCEARWYMARRTPWGIAKKGDLIYFKNSAEPVTACATISDVYQYEVKDNDHALEIMKKHIKADLGTDEIPEEILRYISNKNYAMFLYFTNVRKIKPFNINKAGFGSMAAWITTEDINKFKL